MERCSAFLGLAGLLGLLAACQFPKHVEHWVAIEVTADPDALPPRAVLLPPRVAVGMLEMSGNTRIDELRSAEAARILSACLLERAPSTLDLALEPFTEGDATRERAVRDTIQDWEALRSRFPTDANTEMPGLGPGLAFLADRGLPAALILAAESWEPTGGRSAWGWFTGGFGAYATVGETVVRLALLETRTGKVLWASKYVQSATAGWKVRSLTDHEAVAQIVGVLMEDVPRRPAESAVALAAGEAP